MVSLLDGDRIATDTEATGLRTWNGAEPFAFSFCNEKGKTAYLECPVDPFTRKVQITNRDRRRLKSILSSPRVRKVFHHAKFDMRAYAKVGVPTKGPVGDTMIKAHVVNSGEITFGLKRLAKHYGGYPDDDEKRLRKAVTWCRRFAKKYKWNLGPDVGADYWLPSAVARMFPQTAKLYKERFGEDLGSLCEEYCTGDSVRTMLLDLSLDPILAREKLKEVYKRELRLLKVTYKMENRGVRVDPAIIHRESRECRKIISKCRKEIIRYAGAKFNPNSPVQLQRYLFGSKKNGGLELEPVKYTKPSKKFPNGQPSTDKDTLDTYRHTVPFIQTLLNMRDAEKALGTYYNNYLRNAVEEDGELILYCNFNQAGPITGRYSASDPNLQNVPKRKKEGLLAMVRGPFGPRRGFIWYDLDFRQIEARIFAEYAREETMLRAFRLGRDVYQELADTIGKLSGVAITRDQAKSIFLGKLYGLGAVKLAYSLGVEYNAAKLLIKTFDETFPKVAEFQQAIIALVSNGKARLKKYKVYDDEFIDALPGDLGYIVTIYGRKIPVDPEFAYKGINYLIQGTAADLLKTAMIRLDDWFMEQGLDAHLVMTIHDELVIEVRKGQNTKSFVRNISGIMSDNQGMFSLVATPVEVTRVRTSWSKKEEVTWLSKEAA